MIRYFVTFLATAALCGAAEKRPNILFLLSDDQSWGDYSFMGHPHIDTPRIDQLAGESIVFTRGYSPVPLCRPSLAAITTGLYPHQHGVTGNDPRLPGNKKGGMAGRSNPKTSKFYTDIIDDWMEHPDWIDSLTKSGYRTLQTGKWWEGNPVEQGGFTHAMSHGDPKRGGRHGDEGLKIGRQGIKPITDFIDKSGDEPWFVWYGVFLPHTPHNPPKELLEKYLKVTPDKSVAAYWACCEWLDQGIGQLLDHLDEKGLRDDTIIIYTTDNGWIQDPKKANRYAPRSKRTVYEGGVRTPIMISWKGTLEPRMDEEHLATNLDIWPTAATLCGTPIPDGLDGIDLTNSKAVEARSTIFGEGFDHDIMELGKPSESLTARFMIEGNWKLIIPGKLGGSVYEDSLYNLAKDPAEKENLAKDFPEKVEAMRKVLDAWWTP